MKKFITSVVCVLAMFVSADERTLKPSVDGIDFDWNYGANYEGGVAPQSGDVVVIPEGVSAKVTAGDNASFALVNSLYRITPKATANSLSGLSD